MNEGSEREAIIHDCRRQPKVWKYFGGAVASFVLLVGGSHPCLGRRVDAGDVRPSRPVAGNASGLIDTSTPGPVLTPKGQQQAQAVVGKLGANNYDAVYASTMVRTQLTAAPMSQYLRLPIQVLPGLQEIEAGVFEGTPESQPPHGYGLFPLAWALPGATRRSQRAVQQGHGIPGSNQRVRVRRRVDGALKTIYDNGDRNPVVFSHGGAIMFWTMMNAQNLTWRRRSTCCGPRRWTTPTTSSSRATPRTAGPW